LIKEAKYLCEILFCAIGLVKSERHAHTFENFNIIVDLKSIVECEEVLHLITRDGAVNHRLLIGVDHKER
jgi:hypothetical protein